MYVGLTKESRPWAQGQGRTPGGSKGTPRKVFFLSGLALAGALGIAVPARAQVSPQVLEEGKKVYETTCMVCHQPTGMGIPGVYPPLAGGEFATGGNRRAISIVLNGLQGAVTVKGMTYNGVMQAWKAVLTDEKIAAVLTYERQSFGNKASPVTPEQVKKVREELANRTTPFTPAEIEQIPNEDVKP
jgi:mono/diheme cytochrome c family protein